MKKTFEIPLLLVAGIASLGLTRGWVRVRAEKEGVSQVPWLQEMDAVDFLGTTALGGLRPLFIDLLWMRAADAFTRRDWFDALPVAELICRLQPNLPRVWEVGSWNMAYNIAASKKQAEKFDEEFDWVVKGVEFQKKGIRKNPDSSEAQLWLALMLYDKGRYDEYRDRWLKAGIDPSTESIRAAREAARLEVGGHRAHQLFGVYVCRKIEGLQTDAEQGQAKETLDLAREAREALVYAKEHCPDHKDFREYREGIDNRILFLDVYLDSSKVSGSEESKQSGDK